MSTSEESGLTNAMQGVSYSGNTSNHFMLQKQGEVPGVRVTVS